MTGWILPEEYLSKALAAGAKLVTDAIAGGTLDELVGRIYANSDRQAAIAQWFTEHRIEITFGWPRAQQTLPSWNIALQTGQNSMEYVGDAGDEDSAERWQDAYAIISRDENPDAVRWLHQLAKFAISRGRVSLSDVFPYKQQLSQQDLKPEEIQGEKGGRTIFARLLTFNCEYDQEDAGAAIDHTDLDEDVELPDLSHADSAF